MRGLRFLIAGFLAVVPLAPASATVVFTDNFNQNTTGNDRTSLTASTVASGGNSAGWTLSSGAVDVSTGQPFPAPGNRFLDLLAAGDTAGKATYNTSFNLVAGGTYTITFNYGTRSLGAANSIIVSLGSSTKVVNLAAGNLASTAFTWVITASSAVTGAQLSFRAGAGVVADNDRIAIDDFVLDYVAPVAPVPLPGSLALFLTGLAGVGLIGRRRAVNGNPATSA